MTGAVASSKTKLLWIYNILTCEKAVQPTVYDLFKYFTKNWQCGYRAIIIKISFCTLILIHGIRSWIMGTKWWTKGFISNICFKHCCIVYVDPCDRGGTQDHFPTKFSKIQHSGPKLRGQTYPKSGASGVQNYHVSAFLAFKQASQHIMLDCIRTSFNRAFFRYQACLSTPNGSKAIYILTRRARARAGCMWGKGPINIQSNLFGLLKLSYQCSLQKVTLEKLNLNSIKTW